MPEIKSTAKIEHLQRLIEFVAGHAKMAGFNAKRINEIELAAEEALVNIFKYAYPGIDGDVVLDCRSENEVGFILEISDNGAPFNILEVPDPDVTADISDREIGGLGVFFIKKMADEARYRRKGSYNILTLVFRKE
jgi:anti-sigma regulatory factor (Ser/Thr protein kinase)